MNKNHVSKISASLSISSGQVESTAKLLTEGCTVPFIARYRKEATGNLDEVAITSVRDMLAQLEELDSRRETILKTIEEQGKLTDKLKAEIMAAETLSKLEDIYLPYRPKRRTRATIAKEKGLEPLAEFLLKQEDESIEKEAEKFIDQEKEVPDGKAALAGARDIIAEMINEDADIREKIRELFRREGRFITKVVKGKEEEAEKFKDYFDWSEPVKTAPSHRVLAMRRGASEKLLTLHIEAPADKAVSIIEEKYITAANEASMQVRAAGEDAFKRLLSMSMETEIRLETKKLADEQAIKVFSENLRELLLSPALGEKRVLALDPAFRTGCKLVCLSRQGRLLYDDVVYPHTGEAKRKEAEEKIKTLCEKYDIETIAYGNGTASRETGEFLKAIDFGREIPVVMVNESGASVYSASEAAREEFPQKDLTVRGAVSIGRRLMDPLAELVKIDPKSIGVGQYQHDVDQKKLKAGLDDTVISCVNSVGVDINTASRQLLTYVSGLGPAIAGRIIEYRDTNGAFSGREELKKVSGVGEKCFQQSAGFLRIRGGNNPLDASAVHPESYSIVENIASDIGSRISEIIANKELVSKIEIDKYTTDKIGRPTLLDIKSELLKPGRDPRKQFEIFSFAEGLNEITDLKPGMKIPGIVTNVTAFGAFVDVGVHQDGLVHISELADKFIKDPMDVVKVHQKVMVTVIDADPERKRISLSMRAAPGKTAKQKPSPAGKEPRKSPRKPGNKKPKPDKKPQPKNTFGEGLNIEL
ncbi:Tex family protein [Sedimentisphaera salicampi]|uniref:30S ribosomal protein S1 n=1 Tax=Sedimentisphaera salicampi TaxID=1941349 RepID=A0A1W6LNZ2_9BACT|nr:Tex family protein [Sedimentisphaera salicampi]ARN57453.1 30S ribosomal protein S1 [Sedimentisphaera salicampi]